MFYRESFLNQCRFKNMKNVNNASLDEKAFGNNKSFSVSNIQSSKAVNKSGHQGSSCASSHSCSEGNSAYKGGRGVICSSGYGVETSYFLSGSDGHSSNNTVLSKCSVTNKQQVNSRDERNVISSQNSSSSSSSSFPSCSSSFPSSFPSSSSFSSSFSSSSSNSSPFLGDGSSNAKSFSSSLSVKTSSAYGGSGGNSGSAMGRSAMPPPPVPPAVIRKPQGKSYAQMESEILKGLRMQQSWNDKSDIQFLCMSVLNLCKLSVHEVTEAHCFYAINSVVQAIDHYRTKLARQNVAMLARYRDSHELALEKLGIEEEIKVVEQSIINAKHEYTRAKKRRRYREEYEKVSREICKKSSVQELNEARSEEMKKKDVVENLIRKIQQKIEYRQKQAFVVLQAANDFKKALTDPIPFIDF